ncbi:MAG TPA: type II toxin-antitoxin system mRNA interferase toxin, RelE/StbE family, partial [Syntrophomonas wolfei]
LPQKYLDHPLTGNYAGHRECHITPDWLLIYKIEKDILILSLTRTGTHSDLF